jgi:hypothetical protein
MPYAEGTQVSQSQSFIEIERTLRRYGATAFMYGSTETEAVVMFDAKGLRLKFRIAVPPVSEFLLSNHKPPRRRSNADAARYQEEEARRRWRALLLVIKAKLESVESGIESFEEAFAAQIVLPGGQTVGQWLGPQLQTIGAGQMPPLLPGGKS